MNKCTVGGCGRNLFCVGLCRTHYRWRQEGRSLDEPIRHRISLVNTTECSVPNCYRPPTTTGWCRACNARWRTQIGPLAPIRISFVDSQGYVRWNKCHPENTFGRTIKEHHAVMIKHLGRELLPTENVHHKNGVRTDNSLDNLELWNVSQPRGQRVDDKVQWAKEILALYGERNS